MFHPGRAVRTSRGPGRRRRMAPAPGDPSNDVQRPLNALGERPGGLPASRKGVRPMEGYEFAKGLDHAWIVAASERVAWTVDEIFGNRRFDASRPIVPASWVGTQDLGFLDEREQRTLNHCRAFSYAHLLG